MKPNDLSETPLDKEAVLEERAAETLYAIGYRLYNQGVYADALAVLSTLSLMVPDNPRYAVATGMAAHGMKDDQTALPHYRRALKIAPDHVPAHLASAESYLALRERDKAKKALAKTLQAFDRSGNSAWTIYRDRANAWLSLMNITHQESETV